MRCTLWSRHSVRFFHGEEPQVAKGLKLSGNFLIASVIEALGEAIALVGKAGIERVYRFPNIHAVYRTGLWNRWEHIAEGKFAPAGFAVPLGHRDIRRTGVATEGLRAPVRLVNRLHGRFLRLRAQQGDALDGSAMGVFAATHAGGP